MMVASNVIARLKVLGGHHARLPRGEKIVSKEVFSISLPLWVNGVTAFGLAQAGLWILGAFLPKEDVGLYFAALRLVSLVSMPLILVNLPLTQRS